MDQDVANELYDTIIVGGGPAGLAAGIYAARARLKALVLDATGGGGQLNVIDIIENYPGYADPVTGPELAAAMGRQMEKFGLGITFDGVESIERDGDVVTVRGEAATYRARTAIVATGARHRELCVPGEQELKGRGVSYCATCDGPFFKGERVVLVGGGDTAVKEAIYLSRIVEHVTVVHRRDRLRAEAVMQEKALATPNIELAWNSVVSRIAGQGSVTGVEIENLLTGARSEIPAAGVFVFIGVVPNTSFLEGKVALDGAGFVKTDLCMRTSDPLVFAAGDVRAGSVRQVASAVGDGTTAVLTIQEMLDVGTPQREQPRACEVPLA